MRTLSRQTPWHPQGEQLAAALIIVTATGIVLGGIAPESMGMAPLAGALVLLLLGSIRREPLAGGCLLLLMLSLRDVLRGGGRYAPAELSLNDVLLVMIAFAATVQASRSFWQTFQGLFAAVIPAAGALAWCLRPASVAGEPFAAGTLTAPQSAVVFGLSLCCATALLSTTPRRSPPWLLWGICAALAGGLVVASGGLGSLLLVALALLFVKLSAWSRNGPDRALRAGGVLAGLLLSGAGAALFLGPTPALGAGEGSLRQRLALLGCFFQAPFTRVERFFHGVGFTNSSTWLCESIHPGQRMIQADNVLAQLTADTGMLTLLVLGCLLLWMVRRIWLLSEHMADPVVLASLGGALYALLQTQIANGWGQSTLIQVLLGLQLAALSLRIDHQSLPQVKSR
jgi:hypothetical protein